MRKWVKIMKAHFIKEKMGQEKKGMPGKLLISHGCAHKDHKETLPYA